MTVPTTDRDDAEIAGEYVLRLMSGEEAQAFEDRLASEPALMALVRDWESGLAPLADDVDDVDPSPRVRSEVERRLFSQAHRAGGLTAILGLLTAAAVTTVVVAFAAGWLVLSTPEFEPELHADVIGSNGSIILEAGYDADNGAFKVIPGIAPPEGSVLELWLIAEGSDTPVSLGVVPESETITTLSAQLAMQLEGGTLALSEEPPGGSPTGFPTGDVLGTGPLLEV